MSAPRIPNKESYWTNKGKIGKKVALYLHDDLDGIFSAIAMKTYLISKGFKIVKYGVVNYQEGWNSVEIDDQLINVAVDFAEWHEKLDVFIDHHGEFDKEKEGEEDIDKNMQ